MTEATISTQAKKVLPPYLNTVKLQKLIEILSTTKVTTITTESLKGEFGATDASVAMGTLRFLRLIDEAGKATDLTRGFHLSGDERTEAIASIVESAYRELFDFVINGKPQNLPQEKLANHFVRVYGVVPRIAIPAVRAFFFLCEEAGMKEKTTTPRAQAVRAKKPAVASPKITTSSAKEKREQSPVMNGDVTAIPFAKGQISFVLPTRILSNHELIGDYKDVLTAINTFVSKCAPFLDEVSDSVDDD